MKEDKGQPHKRMIEPLIILVLDPPESSVPFFSTSTFCFLMSISGNKLLKTVSAIRASPHILLDSSDAFIWNIGLCGWKPHRGHMLSQWKECAWYLLCLFCRFVKVPYCPRASKDRQTVTSDHHLSFLPTSMDQCHPNILQAGTGFPCMETHVTH